MKIVSTCPCCSSPMLHHFCNHREYWFCRKCWEEMPDLSDIKEKNQFSEKRVVNLSANLLKRDRAVAI
ncbi:hypothetical protein [Hyella patelloides]|uniref:hypothetical protein n=1 Tax=Hyella patelloides TaxID=1982969 RepID=UPI00119C937D|nr:hypothetical protein [Hyella patelloides]